MPAPTSTLLTFSALQQANARRVPYFGHTLESWSPMEWACATAGELGELCNLLKKLSRVEDPKRPGHDLTGKARPTREEVADELADTLIYLDLLASRLNIDLGDAVRAKWNRVSAKMEFPERL